MSSIAVIIPLYNKEKTILRAIKSIINQKESVDEIIVIDDGSCDSSLEIINDYLSNNKVAKKVLKIYSQKNQGECLARYNGILKVSSEYICLLDADDYWLDNHILNLKKAIVERSSLVDVFSMKSIKQTSGGFVHQKTKGTHIYDYSSARYLKAGYINMSSICLNKSIIKREFFDEKMKNFGDVFTIFALCGNKGFAFCEKESVIVDRVESLASKKIDFQNYLRLRKNVLSCKKSFLKENLFFLKFFIYSNLAIQQDLFKRDIFKGALSLFNKAPFLSIFSILLIIIPIKRLKMILSK